MRTVKAVLNRGETLEFLEPEIGERLKTEHSGPSRDKRTSFESVGIGR